MAESSNARPAHGAARTSCRIPTAIPGGICWPCWVFDGFPWYRKGALHERFMIMPRGDAIIARIFAAFGRRRDDAIQWCRGRNWLLRLPVSLMLGYFGIAQAINPNSWTLFSGINLPIHEGGHLLFRMFGWEFLHAAGGTLLQLFAPIASAVVFSKQRDYFAIAFCFAWLSTNVVSMGVYMADAEAMQLPLVTAEGGGFIVNHDWHFLLSQLGLLHHCEAIGWLTRQAGNLVMIGALGLCGWLMAQMYSAPKDAD